MKQSGIGSLMWMIPITLSVRWLGPHPYPLMVRDFQSVIGQETREQVWGDRRPAPGLYHACVGGGSNAIGIFHPFLQDREVQLVGVEAGGAGLESGRHLGVH